MIRVATERDCETLATLHRAAFADGWSGDALREMLRAPGVCALTADDGFIVVRTVADEAEILTLAVAPDARRRGRGGALLHAAVAHARRSGAARLFLEVSTKNAAALALYVSAGFREIGRRARYYPDGADALTMSLTLL